MIHDNIEGFFQTSINSNGEIQKKFVNKNAESTNKKRQLVSEQENNRNMNWKTTKQNIVQLFSKKNLIQEMDGQHHSLLDISTRSIGDRQDSISNRCNSHSQKNGSRLTRASILFTISPMLDRRSTSQLQ